MTEDSRASFLKYILKGSQILLLFYSVIFLILRGALVLVQYFQQLKMEQVRQIQIVQSGGAMQTWRRLLWRTMAEGWLWQLALEWQPSCWRLTCGVFWNIGLDRKRKSGMSDDCTGRRNVRFIFRWKNISCFYC